MLAMLDSHECLHAALAMKAKLECICIELGVLTVQYIVNVSAFMPTLCCLAEVPRWPKDTGLAVMQYYW